MNYAKRDYLEGHVVVRMISLGIGRPLPTTSAYLSPQDQERAGRFRFPEDRARFITGRELFGQCLSHYFGHPAGPLDLSISDRGRPFLAKDRDIQFSISHSGNWIAVALSLQTLAGVDLEQLITRSSLEDLASRIMSPLDFTSFQALPNDEKQAAFFHTWTGKEALVKAIGQGIATDLKAISIPPRRTDGATQILRISNPQEPSPWRLQGLPLPPGYLGNVAWNDPRKQLDIRVIGSDTEALS
jgi:4'-phosphopantetheinyl transferase